MAWREMNIRSQVAVAMAAIAVLSLAIPEVAFFMGLLGASFGSTAWLTSPEGSVSKRVAKIAMLVSITAFVVLIAGTWLYTLLNAT